MRIIEHKNADKVKWDEFVQANSMGHTYHLYDMVRYDWYTERQNLSFAIIDDADNIAMISMLYLQAKPQTLWQKWMHKKQIASLFSRWGFVLRDGLTAKQRAAVKKVYMEHIDSIVKQYKLKTFEIALPPFCDAFRPENCPDVNPLIHFGFAPKQRYTYIIDLSQGEKAVFSGYEASTRNILNKVERANQIEIIESSGTDNDFQLFKDIHIDCYKQTGGHFLSEKYLRNIFDAAAHTDTHKLYFIKEAGLVKAAIILVCYKDTVYYLWEFSYKETEGYINKYFLHSLIKKMGAQGYHWFEVGGALPWLRDGKYKGLNDYKKSFSKVLHPIYAGVYVKDNKR